MKETKWIMGMPVTVHIADTKAAPKDLEEIFQHFTDIDNRFSTYKTDSEISLLNAGKISQNEISSELKEVLALSEQTKLDTNGYFDIQTPRGTLDPSGLVKGWAVWKAAQKLAAKGLKNFFVEAGGDAQVSGNNPEGKPWTVGIKNPFNQSQIVKVLRLQTEGVATSGNYIRGAHIYDPKTRRELGEIVSLTVVAKNVYEADRLATAAYAMGKNGIYFLERFPGVEAYAIDRKGIGTETSNFKNFLA